MYPDALGACRGISFETPPMVREQWAQQHGLSWYLTDEYTEALAQTCAGYDVKMSEQLTSALLDMPEHMS